MKAALIKCPRCKALVSPHYAECLICGRAWPRPRPTRKPRKSEVKASRPAARLWRVGERDGWTCHLCGHDVVWGAKGDDAPSLDHLVPRSRGGRDALANLKLAHRGCNIRRGNAPLAQPGHPAEAKGVA